MLSQHLKFNHVIQEINIKCDIIITWKMFKWLKSKWLHKTLELNSKLTIVLA